MKLHEVVAQSINRNMSAVTFLSKWTQGSTQAVLSLKPSAKEVLKTSVKDSKYLVYRGWKFHDEDDVADVFGSSHPNLKKGAKVKIKLDTLHSWTKDRKEAIKFSNPKYDSLEQRWVDSADLDELGYDEGDLIGIGILVAAEIPKDLVIADLENVDSDLLHYVNQA